MRAHRPFAEIDVVQFQMSCVRIALSLSLSFYFYRFIKPHSTRSKLHIHTHSVIATDEKPCECNDASIVSIIYRKKHKNRFNFNQYFLFCRSPVRSFIQCFVGQDTCCYDTLALRRIAPKSKGKTRTHPLTTRCEPPPHHDQNVYENRRIAENDLDSQMEMNFLVSCSFVLLQHTQIERTIRTKW